GRVEAVGVADPGAGGDVHRAAVLLVLEAQLAQPGVVAPHLVDDVAAGAAGGHVPAGEQVRPAGRVVGRLPALDRLVHAAAEAGDRIGREPADHVVAGGVRVAVAVQGRRALAQGIDRKGLLLRRARAAAGLVGVTDFGQQVVGVDVAAAGAAGRRVHVLRGLEGAARQDRLEGQHVVAAVVGEFRGAVAGVRGRAVGVGGDRPDHPAGVVVLGAVDQAARVGHIVHPAGGAVAPAGAQR